LTHNALLTLQWTVDMFLIISLRRPDILPYTDLGVQKGLLRFALTAHNAFPGAKGKFQLKKKEKMKAEPSPEGQLSANGRATPPPQSASGAPPTPMTPSNMISVVVKGTLHTPNAPGGSSAKPTLPPTPFTPGQATLEVQEAVMPEAAPEDLLEPIPGPAWDPHRIAPLGELTIETMKSRWSGKKAK
jgi:DNA-3-methyladenine glycosylase II